MKEFWLWLKGLFVEQPTVLYGSVGEAPSAVMLVLNDVAYERGKQDVQWGDQTDHTDLYWLGIHVEELGEVAKAIIEGEGIEHVREELIQLSATCACHVQAIDERRARTQQSMCVK